jgi:hypothetical protein
MNPEQEASIMKALFGTTAFLVAIVIGMCSHIAADPARSRSLKLDGPNLDVQYAQARLELAKANLKRVEVMNRRVARAVSPNVVAQYRNDLVLAELRLQLALGANSDPYSSWLKAAELNWKSAKADWQSAVAANDKQPGTVNELDVEKLRLQAELFRIGFDRGQALADSSRQSQLEWRLSMLGDEVDRLSESVFRAAPASGRAPVGVYYYIPQGFR